MPLFDRIAAAWDSLSAPEQPTTLGLQALATSNLSQPQQWLLEALGGGGTASGRRVTPETAMRQSTVFACERVLSESVAQLPMQLMRERKDGGLDPADDHPLYDILANGWNDETTAQDGVELGMNHMLLRGTRYSQVVRDQVGRIQGLFPLAPDGVQVRRNEVTGRLLYDYYPPYGGNKETFEADEIWRTNGLSANGIQGLSIIGFARESIGTQLAMEEHGAKLFANGASIGTVLEAPGSVTEEQIVSLKRQMKEFEGSRNAHKTLILENQMKVSAGLLGMNSKDSQWIEARRLGIEDICRYFGVPPHKVQELARATFNNIEHLSLDFYNSSLNRWTRRFALSGWRDLLLTNEKKRYVLVFNTHQLMQGDSQAQANTESIRIASRVLNPNEVRRTLGKAPYEGGEKYENPNTTTAAPKPGSTEADTQKG